jgi:hypothetical protein
MAKEKLIRQKIEVETNPDGIPLLRVTLRKGANTYVRGVAAADYMDEEHPEKRKSVDRHWINDIEKLERLKEIDKGSLDARAKAMEGEEVLDE